MILSFRYALAGLRELFRRERNFRIHLLAAALVISLGIVLHMSRTEMVIIILLIAMVLSMEALNTAIERFVDSISEKRSPKAKLAKDTAAAAVLITALTSIVIGVVLFIPKILALFRSEP
jgi:diacylglycerol kinase